MARTLEEVREEALELPPEARAALSEELAVSLFEPEVLKKWLIESDRRYQRILSGEDQVLTLEEFWRDDE